MWATYRTMRALGWRVTVAEWVSTASPCRARPVCLTLAVGQDLRRQLRHLRSRKRSERPGVYQEERASHGPEPCVLPVGLPGSEVSIPEPRGASRQQEDSGASPACTQVAGSDPANTPLLTAELRWGGEQGRACVRPGRGNTPGDRSRRATPTTPQAEGRGEEWSGQVEGAHSPRRVGEALPALGARNHSARP